MIFSVLLGDVEFFFANLEFILLFNEIGKWKRGIFILFLTSNAKMGDTNKFVKRFCLQITIETSYHSGKTSSFSNGFSRQVVARVGTSDWTSGI